MLVIAKREALIPYILVTVLLLAGLILSILSYLHICTTACAEGHHYLLFNKPFEYFGIGFFSFLLGLHLASLHRPLLQLSIGTLIIGALGAELWFIWMQHAIIKHWCPICLGIALSLFLCAAILLSQQYLNSQRGEFMKKSIGGSIIFLIGFVVAFFGVVKVDELQAAQDNIKSSIAFGNKNSPIEIYLFTDWQCPACRQLEPTFEAMAPAVMDEGQVIFVDVPIHQETLNFTPYNLAFMMNNKEQYWKLRNKLQEISNETGEPTDEMIEKAAASEGTYYKHLNFADITIAQKFFKQLAKDFNINQTPTLVIVNKENNKGKKLIGGEEITQDNVIKVIRQLKS